MVTWAYPSLQPQRNLDRFSRFAGLINVTDRQADLANRSVTIWTASTYVVRAMRSNNISQHAMYSNNLARCQHLLLHLHLLVLLTYFVVLPLCSVFDHCFMANKCLQVRMYLAILGILLILR